jgi:hypothetical protein
MKSTAYGKWFPRRIRPQNGHGYSVAAQTAEARRPDAYQSGAATEVRPNVMARRESSLAAMRVSCYNR